MYTAKNLLRIRSMNCDAKIVESTRCSVALDDILNTNLFDFDKASQSPGWLKVMRGGEGSEIDEYGVASIFFKDKRPFHPQKFYEFMHTEFEGLYRAKGYFWIPTQAAFMGEIAIAGGVREYYPSGLWWAGTPQSEWPQDRETLEFIQENWDPRFGDRMQQLIFIGKSEILGTIQSALEMCLLTDEEIEQGPELAREFPDPFGDWSLFLQEQREDGQESPIK